MKIKITEKEALAILLEFMSGLNEQLADETAKKIAFLDPVSVGRLQAYNEIYDYLQSIIIENVVKERIL